MTIKTIGEYRIEYQPDRVQNSGYRVYKQSWQTHRNGKPIKTSMSKRRPRWKLTETYETLDEAESALNKEITSLSACLP